MTPPGKGVRRRAGHKSCEACQVMKLRCVREIRDLACNRCKTLGHECKLPDRPPRKLRTGKRIELAKTLYGEADIASTCTSPAPFTFGPPAVCDLSEAAVVETSEVDGYTFGVVEDVIWSAESSSSSCPSSPAISSTIPKDNSIISDAALSDMFHISEYSVESVLSSVELCGQLSSNLIEEWFDTCPFPVPISRWKDFRVQFDEAGRKPEQLLSPGLEVLAALLISNGAHISSAPCVLGVDIAGLDLFKDGLAYFGKSRAAVCHALAQRTMRLADRLGIFREESNESISVLLLLATSLDRNDPQRVRGRPYRKAAAAHARAIAEDGPQNRDFVELVDGPLGWMLYINDTWEAASSGREPNLKGTDEEIMFRDVEHELPTIDDLSCALNGDGRNSVWYPVGKMWAYVTRLMRNVHRYLRQDPPSPEVWSVILETYEKLDDYKRCFISMQAILAKFFVSRSPGFTLLRQHMAMSLFPNLLVTFYIHRALNNWLEASPTRDMLSLDDMIALLTLKTESDRRMAQSARELAQLFEYLQQILPSPGALSLLSSIGIAYVTLPTWADQLCALPTLDDGFLTNYTVTEKVKEMGWFMDVVHALSWSYDDKTLDKTRATLQRGLAIAGAVGGASMP